jgi:hypothetical protein
MRWNLNIITGMKPLSKPEGYHDPEHMPFGECSGPCHETWMELNAFTRQGVSTVTQAGRAYAFQVWRVPRALRLRWNLNSGFMPLGKTRKYPEHKPIGECSGQEHRLCFYFVKHLSVPGQPLTQCPPRSRGCCGCCGRSWC